MCSRQSTPDSLIHPFFLNLGATCGAQSYCLALHSEFIPSGFWDLPHPKQATVPRVQVSQRGSDPSHCMGFQNQTRDIPCEVEVPCFLGHTPGPHHRLLNPKISLLDPQGWGSASRGHLAAAPRGPTQALSSSCVGLSVTSVEGGVLSWEGETPFLCVKARKWGGGGGISNQHKTQSLIHGKALTTELPGPSLLPGVRVGSMVVP